VNAPLHARFSEGAGTVALRNSRTLLEALR
jgi:hypothetical protein